MEKIEEMFDQMEGIESRFSGLSLVVDGLLSAIGREGVPSNLDDARKLISEESDLLSKKMRALTEALQNAN